MCSTIKLVSLEFPPFCSNLAPVPVCCLMLKCSFPTHGIYTTPPIYTPVCKRQQHDAHPALPIHTSPKHPMPSFLSKCMDSRMISHASLDSPIVWGLRLGQTFVSRWQRPSLNSVKGWGGMNDGERMKWKMA